MSSGTGITELNRPLALSTLQLVACQGFVTYYPELANRLGSFKAAIFLGHALYWSKHVNSKFRYRDGWFYLSAKQCQLATGLSTREQVTARELLIDHKLLQERKAGKPVTLNYRIDLKELREFLGLNDQAEEAGSKAKDFASMLGASITFYKPLADITGSVATGLYLSYVLQRFRNALEVGKVQRNGAFTVTQESVRNALCLGIKTQRTARQRLKAAGFIVELTAYSMSVNMPALESLLKGAPLTPLKSAKAAASPEANQAGPIRSATPTSSSRKLFAPATLKQADLFTLKDEIKQSAVMLNSAVRQNFGLRAGKLFTVKPLSAEQSLECQTVAENAIRGLPSALVDNLDCALPAAQSPSAQSAIHDDQSAIPNGQNRNPWRPKAQNINNTTDLKVTTTTAVSGCGAEQTLCGCCDLEDLKPKPESQSAEDVTEIPAVVESKWHHSLKSVLCSADSAVQQRLMDELEGRIRFGSTAIANPPGFIRSLLVKLQAGQEITLAYAERVESERKKPTSGPAGESTPYVKPQTYTSHDAVTGEKFKDVVDFSSPEARRKLFEDMGLGKRRMK